MAAARSVLVEKCRRLETLQELLSRARRQHAEAARELGAAWIALEKDGAVVVTGQQWANMQTRFPSAAATCDVCPRTLSVMACARILDPYASPLVVGRFEVCLSESRSPSRFTKAADANSARILGKDPEALGLDTALWDIFADACTVLATPFAVEQQLFHQHTFASLQQSNIEWHAPNAWCDQPFACTFVRVDFDSE